jgi:hypothetical protein
LNRLAVNKFKYSSRFQPRNITTSRILFQAQLLISIEVVHDRRNHPYW